MEPKGIEAIEEAYRSDYRRFLRVALAILRDEALAHDAVQEAFAQALKERDALRNEAAFDGWLWRIVVNAALRARRKLHTEPATPLTSEAVASADETDEFGVRRWIAALPERQRLAVYLRYYADLDYRAIARALDIEVGTVSATLAAAHQALRRSLPGGCLMIDVEPLIRLELDLDLPLPSGEGADWLDVLRRAGLGAAERRSENGRSRS